MPLRPGVGWPNRLDHDQLCQLLADGQACIADLADEIRPAGQQLDDLLLTEANLAQTVLKFGCGAQLLDPDRDSRFNPAQRTKLTLGFLSEG
jgi:hypothetical protein